MHDTQNCCNIHWNSTFKFPGPKELNICLWTISINGLDWSKNCDKVCEPKNSLKVAMLFRGLNPSVPDKLIISNK